MHNKSLMFVHAPGGMVRPRIENCVEFALHPQHETSCDSEIHIEEDLKRKFRKQLGSLARIPLNSKDKEEALECQC